MRSPRKCARYGCKISLPYGNKSGFCMVHWPDARRKVPEGRKNDYQWLQSRGLTKAEALAHIAAGLPCERTVRIPTIGHKKVSTLEAVRLASEAMNISASDVLSTSKFGFVVDCRAVVVRVMSAQGLAYAEIGRRLKRDHSSIKHLDDTFPKRAAKRPVLATVVDDILARAA